MGPRVTIAPAMGASVAELCTQPENSEALAITATHTRTNTLLVIARGVPKLSETSGLENARSVHFVPSSLPHLAALFVDGRHKIGSTYGYNQHFSPMWTREMQINGVLCCFHHLGIPTTEIKQEERYSS